VTLGATAAYAAGLLTLAGATAAALARFGPSWGIPDVRAAQVGVAVATATEVVVFATLAYGLVAAPHRFLRAWLAATLVKIAAFGGAIGYAAAVHPAAARSLATGCAAAFVVLSHHEVFVLCRWSDRASKRRGPGGGDGP